MRDSNFRLIVQLIPRLVRNCGRWKGAVENLRERVLSTGVSTRLAILSTPAATNSPVELNANNFNVKSHMQLSQATCRLFKEPFFFACTSFYFCRARGESRLHNFLKFGGFSFRADDVLLSLHIDLEDSIEWINVCRMSFYHHSIFLCIEEYYK